MELFPSKNIPLSIRCYKLYAFVRRWETEHAVWSGVKTVAGTPSNKAIHRGEDASRRCATRPDSTLLFEDGLGTRIILRTSDCSGNRLPVYFN